MLLNSPHLILPQTDLIHVTSLEVLDSKDDHHRRLGRTTHQSKSLRSLSPTHCLLLCRLPTITAAREEEEEEEEEKWRFLVTRVWQQILEK